MKIALCKSHFFGPVSGADEILVTYAIRLHQAAHDVRVVLLYKPSENDPFYARLKRCGVPVSYVIKRSIAFSILRAVRSLFPLFLVVFSDPALGRALAQNMADRDRPDLAPSLSRLPRLFCSRAL